MYQSYSTTCSTHSEAFTLSPLSATAVSFSVSLCTLSKTNGSIWIESTNVQNRKPLWRMTSQDLSVPPYQFQFVTTEGRCKGMSGGPPIITYLYRQGTVHFPCPFERQQTFMCLKWQIHRYTCPYMVVSTNTSAHALHVCSLFGQRSCQTVWWWLPSRSRGQMSPGKECAQGRTYTNRWAVRKWGIEQEDMDMEIVEGRGRNIGTGMGVGRNELYTSR